MLDHEVLMMEALDGTITSANLAQLETYLRTHPEARAMFDAMIAVDNALVAAPLATPNAQFTGRVMQSVVGMQIARPLKAQHIAMIVGTNTVAVIGFWIFAAIVLGGLISFAAPGSLVEAARAIGSVLYGVLGAFAKIGRVVFSHPMTWVIMIVCVSIVAAWLGVLAKLFSPQRQLAPA